MKYVFYLLAFLPLFLSAQDDSKYLDGAVPVEKGRVVFTKKIDAPSMSRQEVYATALQWANERFVTNDEEGQQCRVAFQNPEGGEIAATGKEYIVFSSTILALDRSLMSYQALIYCEDNACRIKLTNIRYEYSVAYQREPEKYAAEEWITDQYALRKGKLNRITGKFRRGTIDFADALFQSAEEAFQKAGVQILPPEETEATAAPEPVTAPGKQAVIPATPIVPALGTPEGFKAMSVEDMPSTLVQLLQQSVLRIKMVDNNITENQAEWKGFGKMFGKDIASITLDADSHFYQQVKDGEVYTLQFAPEPFSQDAVWMIIECSKQGETAEGDKRTVIGEVLKIWVK